MSLVDEASAGPAEERRTRSPLWVLLAGLVAAAVVVGVFVVNGQEQPGHSAQESATTALAVTVTMRVAHGTVTAGAPIPVTVTVDNQSGITWEDPGVCQNEAIGVSLSNGTTPPRLAKQRSCSHAARFPPGRTVEHLGAPTVDTEHGGKLPGGTYAVGFFDRGTGLPVPAPVYVTLLSHAVASPLVSTGVGKQALTTVDLPSGRVQAGQTLTGTLTVANLTAHTLWSSNRRVCQSNAYTLELSGPDRQVARVPFARATCDRPFGFPLGALNQPLAVAAVDTATGQPLRPGRYRARVRLNGFALTLPRPIIVTVTPAPSPGGAGVEGYPG